MMPFDHKNRIFLFMCLILVMTLAVAGSNPTAQAQSGTDETPTPTAPPASPADPGSDFYGVNFIAPVEPWMTLAWESGTRVVRWQFNWRDHETAPGQWAWASSDEPIRIWTAKGFKIHAILHYPPDFRLRAGAVLVPEGIDLPWNDPGNYWATYCNTFAKRYRGKIASYEIWNEPDLDQYWDGNSREYYQLLKTCYQAIKAADPTVPVAMAGMALLIEPNFFPDVVRYAANDGEGITNNHFFDVMAIHMYAAPQLGYDLTNQTRSVLAEYGMAEKPIWITEIGLALRGHGRAPAGPQWGYGTEEEAAWYAMATVANAIAARAERVMWFRLADDGMDEAYGLLRSDGTKRPTYEAWRTSAAILHDIVAVSREIRNGVVIIDMTRADGARIVVLYSETGAGRNITIPARAPAAAVINAVGSAFPVAASASGQYELYAPEARGRDFSQLYDYSVGGPPLILMEFDNEPPSASIEAIAIEGDKKHVLVKWTGSDGQFGTGIATYDVEVSKDGGHTWIAWLTGTTDSEGIYDVSEGGRFLFRSRATDKSGNLGEFSLHAEFVNKIVGTIIAQVIDMRGQYVPFARVELADGSLHDADETGRVIVEVPPGTAHFNGVDGSGQGFAIPPPLEIGLGEEIQVTWMLEPRDNLIPNFQFEQGLNGWGWSSTRDALAGLSDQEGFGAVLKLSGSRRPWGPPSAWVTVNVPPGLQHGIISFYYRIIEAGDQTLQLRVVTNDGQYVLWQSNTIAREFSRVWVDVSPFAGKQVTVVLEWRGTKGAAPGLAEIDQVVFGDVPVLNTGTAEPTGAPTLEGDQPTLTPTP